MKTIKRLATAAILAMFLAVPVMAQENCPTEGCQTYVAKFMEIFPPDYPGRDEIERKLRKDCEKLCGKQPE